MDAGTSILWFRQDLRIHDNPALAAAAERGEVLPVFILDDVNAGEDAPGEASRVWLHHSLSSLDEQLDGALHVASGDATKLLPELARKVGARAVFWNRAYEPWRTRSDAAVEAALGRLGIEVQVRQASLLWEPWDLLKEDGTPYRVFTPYHRRAMRHPSQPRRPLRKTAFRLSSALPARSIDDLGLLGGKAWEERMLEHWQVGEKAAMARLGEFVAHGLEGYIPGRDVMAANHVSRLSVHLRFGEISPHQIWHGVEGMHGEDRDSAEGFKRQLCWREFQASLLHHNPELRRENLNRDFDGFDWRSDDALLAAWQEGRTGIPLVDAAMRELWQTGYMHNRMRMVTGSFLVKNLRLHWHHGEAWFWNCLVDADHANNSASWQWIAGCGADAAPYYRIFNVIRQAERFDAGARYTRRYVPELAALPDRYIHAPWTAPALELEVAGVRLGENYPHPVVDLRVSREAALRAFHEMREAVRARR